MKRGLVVYAVMLTLKDKPVYVTDIITQLEKSDFVITEGTLYPLLNRLKRENIVDYERQESPQGPPRKYYKLSPTGHKQLKNMDDERLSISDSITQLHTS